MITIKIIIVGIHLRASTVGELVVSTRVDVNVSIKAGLSSQAGTFWFERVVLYTCFGTRDRPSTRLLLPSTLCWKKPNVEIFYRHML